MHRSAWKGYSAKFGCSIVHRTGQMRGFGPHGPVKGIQGEHHILWGRMDMRVRG